MPSYHAFRQGLPGAEYDLDTAVIKLGLVRSYAFDPDHVTVADALAAGAVFNGSPVVVPNITRMSDGAVDGDDVNIATTASGIYHYPLLFQASAPTGGVDLPANQQRLIYYFATGPSVPILPKDGVVEVVWPNTGTRIFRIS